MKMSKGLGILIGFCMIFGLAQAGGLKWYNDGSVDIITHEDNEVIHLSKGQLGTMFGKGNTVHSQIVNPVAEHLDGLCTILQ